MRLFLAKFEDRTLEIHNYFEFVQTIEYDLDEKKYTFKNDEATFNLVKVLKANCFMMLYNLVEGSITEAIDAIFEAISLQNLRFDQLIPAYQRIWLAYQTGLVKITAESAKAKDATRNKVGKALPEVMRQLPYFKILTFTDKEGNTYKNYKGFLKVVDVADITGNLDARKMRELAEKYAFSVPERCDELLKVKNIRNQLAHGEIIFSEVGTVGCRELMQIKTNILDYLQTVLLSINDLIDSDSFKA
jgi:MAE_28990/MAE_18760-like HEPN